MTTRRPGLSLVEVAIVIGLLGILGVAIGSTVVHQQRFTADTSELLKVREGVRDAMEVLSADIRGSSTADTIRLMADSAVELFASIGTSVVCGSLSPSVLFLADESPGGNTLTSFLVRPDTGDVVLLYVDDGTAGSERRWARHRIAAFEERASTAGCLAEGGSPRERFTLTLESPAGSPPRQGTPVRFVRRGRYSLYRSSDREWYLGYRRCNSVGPSICNAIQPVSGPYRPYNADPADSGFLFEYFDARGERVGTSNSPLMVARIDITARSVGRGRGKARIADSATTSIAIRNR